jgi:hypothetical protein
MLRRPRCLDLRQELPQRSFNFDRGLDRFSFSQRAHDFHFTMVRNFTIG